MLATLHSFALLGDLFRGLDQFLRRALVLGQQCVGLSQRFPLFAISTQRGIDGSSSPESSSVFDS